MQSELKLISEQHLPNCERSYESGVKLISCDREGVVKVAAALLFSQGGCSLGDLQNYCRKLSEEEVARILDAGCNSRECRRHKSPRALEHAEFTFEIVADFGAYRDLHRHRLLTQERQFLCCDYGYYTPPEIEGTPYEGEYREALEQAKAVYDLIAAELPEEAQYVVPMAYNIRWYFHVNLRALQWLCELRSSPAGHPCYRYIAQAMARQVSNTFPPFERFFKFVDYDGYRLGRLGQEQRKEEKQQTLLI
jgi:thymidylate synthase ThyX